MKWFVQFECELFPRPLEAWFIAKTAECPGHLTPSGIEHHEAVPYQEESNGKD